MTAATFSDVYLSQSGQVVLDTFGNGLITFSPGVGQYWRPSIVHVGSLTGSPVTCDVHVGAAPATQSGTTYSDPSSIKDSTPLGADDTTGILSGTVVFPGQAITIHFRAGQPFDQCIAEVIGISSPQPPPYGNLPAIPGVRFAGSVFNPPSNHGLLSTNIVNMAASSSLSVFPGPANSINVDAFGYIALTISAQLGLNVRMEMTWSTDPIQQVITAVDEFSFLSGDILRMSIPVKGAYLSITFLSAAASPGQLEWEIEGSQVGYRAQFHDDSNILFQVNGANLAAGGNNIQDATVIWPGPALFTAYSDTASATYDIQLTGVKYNGTTTPICRGSNLHPFFCSPVYLPSQHIRMTFHNSSAGTIFIFFFLSAQPIFP